MYGKLQRKRSSKDATPVSGAERWGGGREWGPSMETLGPIKYKEEERKKLTSNKCRNTLYHSCLPNSEGKDAKKIKAYKCFRICLLHFKRNIKKDICSLLTVWWVMCMPADWVPSECQSGAGQQRHVSPKSEYRTWRGPRWMNPAWRQRLKATVLHYLQPEISSLPWQQTAFTARDLPRTVVPC